MESNGTSPPASDETAPRRELPPRRQRWLAIAGPVSSYTWELFSQISRRSGVHLEVFHNPPPEQQIRSTFAHESFQSGEAIARDWGQMNPLELVRAMDVPSADAILLFGTRSRLALADTVARRARHCPVVFVGDTNVADVFPRDAHGWLRLLFYRAFAGSVTEAWTLGRSNEQAFRLLGFRRFRTLPFYSVDYRELGDARTDVLGTDQQRFQLLSIARLVPEKNLEALIRALDCPDLRERVALTIVGDGPSRAQIETLVRTLPTPHVRLAGPVPHAALGEYLRRSHGLVLPSRYEPWGNVVTEALGMGMPVLATPEVGAATSSAGRYGGVRIADGSDPEALREGLRSFFKGYPSLAQAAVEQSTSVRAEFDVTHVAQRMISAIDELRALRARPFTVPGD